MTKKKTGNFYGSKIQTGKLHQKMHVKKGNKIPLAKIQSQLQSIKRQLKNVTDKKKRAALVKKERELVFAKNAKTKFNK